MPIDDLLKNEIEHFKHVATIDAKFNSLNLIIELERRSKYEVLLYTHLKLWLKYYILSVTRKKFSYDEIIFEKVCSKISYLTKKKEQLQIVKFFIRILSQYQLTSELEQFKGYKKQLELEALIEEKKYFTFCLKRSLYSFTSLMVTLMISIVIFSSFFYILQEYFGCLSIELSKYTDTTFLNYIWNMVAYIFNIGEKLQLDSWHELLFMSFLKIYFYLLITYFIVKEITQKVEKI